MNASRLPRRAFAAPLVMIAAVPACIVASQSDPQPGGSPPPQANVETRDHRTAPPDGERPPHKNPPPPRPPTTEHPGHGDPTPPPTADKVPVDGTAHPGDAGTAQTKPKPPDHARNWTVMVAADGSCEAHLDVSCPPNAKCNPPAPTPVECPAGITAERPMRLFARAGSDECFVEIPSAKCPAKATCNPPPPRKHACPQ